MFVRDRMSARPITVTPETSLHDALRTMREEKIRRLPVLDRKGKLVGIVLERDLLYASPSPATNCGCLRRWGESPQVWRK